MKRLTQRMSILMILVLSFAFVGIANATDWYVDFFGNNGNDGRDPGLPLRTINKAIEKAFDGDVIYIAYANGNDYEPIDGSIVPGGDNDLIFR